MSEHITILSKEAITRGLVWPPVIIGIIGILFVLSVFVVLIVKPKRIHSICAGLMICEVCCLFAMLIATLICTIFFPVETGRYKYTGTLSDEMSIKEYKEFEETYTNITYKEGVWHWEDKEQ